MLKGKSLIWYNTLWDTMAGGHDDDLHYQIQMQVMDI